MSNTTDTHRRCSKCRAWKWHHEYYANMVRCKECKLEADRRRYARMTDEQLDRKMERMREDKRRRRLERHHHRLADAQFMLESLKQRGLSTRAVSRLTGCDFNTIKRVATGNTRHVTDATLAKVQAGYRREVMA